MGNESWPGNCQLNVPPSLLARVESQEAALAFGLPITLVTPAQV